MWPFNIANLRLDGGWDDGRRSYNADRMVPLSSYLRKSGTHLK